VASSGSVPMYVSGSPVVASSTTGGGGAGNSSGGGGGGGGSGGGSGGSGGAGTYVIQGGYMLGSASQSYSHTTRASPATVRAPHSGWRGP
jgi:regulatory factor X 1/2/3